MTGRRICWAWPCYHTFVDRAGRHLDMREICPKDVKAMAVQDSAAAMWAKWTRTPQWAELAPRPCLEPLAQLCTSRRNTSAVTRRTVEHLVTMGPVTQAVLYQWGLAEDDKCQACLAAARSREDVGHGTSDVALSCEAPSQLTQHLDDRLLTQNLDDRLEAESRPEAS